MLVALWVLLIPMLIGLTVLSKQSTRWSLSLDDGGIELFTGSKSLWRAEWSEIRRVSVGAPNLEGAAAKFTAVASALLPQKATDRSRFVVLHGDGWTRNIPISGPIWGDMPASDALLAEIQRHGVHADYPRHD
jgi:hypothetical protein